jgi:hypothetical protein
MLSESVFNYVIYAITSVIILSAFWENKQTRYASAFFWGSVVLTTILVAAAALNWWLYRSALGGVIVIFIFSGLCMTRFRLVIYALRFRKLTLELSQRVREGYRIALVLPEGEDEKAVLLSRLQRVLPVGTFLHAPMALGPLSGELLNRLSQHHSAATGYLMACEGQIAARSWLSVVENGDPATSIAVNFHLIPDLE